MTKETIIINNIDVAGCHALCSGNTCFLSQHYSFTEPKYKSWCKDNPNCHYKQLQRKISECAKLEKDVEEWHIKYAGCDTANSSIQELNKQLEEDLTALQQIYNACEKEYKSLNIKHNALLKENSILKSRVNILETQVNNLLENTSEVDD